VAKVNWRKKKNVMRIGVLVAVIGVMVTVFFVRGVFDLDELGYLGIALASLVASAGLVLPVPALAAVCASSPFLNPLLVGLIAGSCEAIGELTGYSLGYTARDILRRGRLYRRLEGWMQRRGWLLLFLASLIPNPMFDVVGVTAGALRYPILGFLGVVWTGKVIKTLLLAYACAYGIEWTVGILGI
jgi:membrane protein YqaA with SNARE-associated domain